MRAIRIKAPGSFDVLELVDRDIPKPGPDDLLVRVRAAGVNRADCMQREGNYPVPPGAKWGDIPGLEVSGEVAEFGSAVTEYKIGDRVFGLVQHGGYSEYVLVDRGLALPIPASLDFVLAAGIIETFATANETVFEVGGLGVGETILVHAGSSGVGITALQMARIAGAHVFVTAGSDGKLERLKALGAEVTINYKNDDFVSVVERAGGVDEIIDFIGPDYLARNLHALRKSGRLVLVGLLGGDTCEFDIRPMLAKRLTVRGFTLRAQELVDKRAIVQRVQRRWIPYVERGLILPVLHCTFPLADAGEAHRTMESNVNIGKIILAVN
jgi:putative PIG3 family NAD(P)H quinone oxidoreductase